jgi:hypothetical protein
MNREFVNTNEPVARSTSSQGVWAPGDPVPEGKYTAILAPSLGRPLIESVVDRWGGYRKINYRAQVIAPIGDIPPGFHPGDAYGWLPASLSAINTCLSSPSS